MLNLLYFIMIIFIIVGILFNKKIINPLTIFNGIWLIVICLYNLKLSYLQDNLSENSIKIFILSIVSFSLFYIICAIFKTKKNITLEKNQIISYLIIKKILIFWIFIEFIETVVSGGLPIIWKITGNTKTYFDYGISSVHGLMNAIGLVLMMLSYYLYEYKKKYYNIKEKKLLYIVFLLLIFYLCLITRQVIISGIIQLIIIKLFFVKKIPWKRLLIGLLIGIILFGIVGNLRTGFNSFIELAMIKNRNTKLFSGFYWVYMYLTMGISNINKAVNNSINSYGLFPILSTFLPSAISNVIYKNNIIIIPNYLISQAFNVSGFFINFYLGYGILGVFFISALYGTLGGVLSKKIKLLNEKNILYYSVYLQIIMLSFFYNHLLYLPSGFQFVIIFFIFNFFKRDDFYEKNKNINDSR